MRLATIELLRTAYGRYALGAFNVSNLEQIHGLFRGAVNADSPFIVQFTRVMRNYADPVMLEQLLQGAETIYPQAIFAIHHDHGDEASCFDAIRSKSYNSVMIDTSHLPFEESILATRRVVAQAHPHGLAVEAELGQVKGAEDERLGEVRNAILTDSDKVEEFVDRSGCDSLAVAIGTSHGAFKFSGNQRLYLDRLAEIQKRLPSGFPMVLHGGSAIPIEEVKRINNAGGQIDTTVSGVSEAEIADAIPLGITKVNIGTDGRLVWTRVHREFFRDSPAEFDFMAPGRIYIKEYAAFVEKKCRCLKSTGKAQDFRSVSQD